LLTASDCGKKRRRRRRKLSKRLREEEEEEEEGTFCYFHMRSQTIENKSYHYHILFEIFVVF